MVKPLLEKVMSRRGGKLPGFLMVIGDEESDDKMVEVSTLKVIMILKIRIIST